MHAGGVENADETPTLARTLRLIYTIMMEQGIGLPQAEHLLNFSARDVRSFLIDECRVLLYGASGMNCMISSSRIFFRR